jgi:transposase
MEQTSIFSATLGLSPPWLVTTVSFASEANRMDITIDFAQGSSFICPHCGSMEKPCHVESETWYHDDFFRYQTYLHASVPHIACCCGVVPVERPWSRVGSKFALLQQSKAP